MTKTISKHNKNDVDQVSIYYMYEIQIYWYNLQQKIGGPKSLSNQITTRIAIFVYLQLNWKLKNWIE